MSTYKQAISFWPISKATLEDFQAIYNLGVTGVELAPRDQWSKLKELGFTIVSTGGHNSLTDGLNKTENHARIADEIAANLALAVEFGIPNLIVFSGNRNGKSEAEGAENTIAGLNLVKAQAEAAGVNLVLELLNSKVDHADYQCDHTSWGVEVVSAVDSPRVKLLYDIYHMQIMEGDLIRNIRDFHQYFGHYHTAGNPGRNDLDENQEIYYPAVARAINATGYTGWVGHEYSPKAPLLESVAQAFAQFNV